MRSLLAITFTALGLVGCKDSERRIVTAETRELTLFDRLYPYDLKHQAPVEWRRIPSTQFRLLNYVTGKDDGVEIVFGITKGSVLENANRWLGQFGQEPLPSTRFFGKVDLLGGQAFLIEAKGNYVPGMGQPPLDQGALIGAIAPSGDSIVTVKMVGPADEVEAQRDNFLSFVASFSKIDRSKTTEFSDPEE